MFTNGREKPRARLIPAGASHHTDDETLRRRFPQLVESLSYFGVHAGEKLSFVGMLLPGGKEPGLTVVARGTSNLDHADVVRLRDFCDRWLRTFELWEVSYSIPVEASSPPEPTKE